MTTSTRRASTRYGSTGSTIGLGAQTDQGTRTISDLIDDIDEAVRYFEMGLKKIDEPQHALGVTNRLFGLYHGILNSSDDAKDVLNRYADRFPDSEFQIVGRNPSASVRKLSNVPGVTVTGTVPDVRPFLASASIRSKSSRPP